MQPPSAQIALPPPMKFEEAPTEEGEAWIRKVVSSGYNVYLTNYPCLLLNRPMRARAN